MKSEFMQRAIELSIENIKENRGGPFGVVIVNSSREGSFDVIERGEIQERIEEMDRCFNESFETEASVDFSGKETGSC